MIVELRNVCQKAVFPVAVATDGTTVSELSLLGSVLRQRDPGSWEQLQRECGGWREGGRVGGREGGRERRE